MRNSLPLLFSFALCVQLASAEARDIKTKSEGCGTTTIGAVDHGKVSVSTHTDCRVIHNYTTRKSVSPYERDMHKVLLARNPTEVALTGATFSPWLDDRGRVSLNVKLSNARDLPVRSVRAELVDAKSGPSFAKLKAFSVERSRIYKTIGAETVSIPAGSSVNLPVAFLDEFLAKISPEPEGFCAYDVSLTANDQFSEEYQKQVVTQMMSGETSSGATRSKVLGIPLRISMESIFEEKLVSHTWVYVSYVDKSSTGKIWYPSKKKFDTPRCLESVATSWVF